MRRLVICLEYRLPDGYHLGSGISSDAADSLLARDGRGRLFLRGSSLAGVLRFEATRLAPHLLPDSPLCLRHPDSGIDSPDEAPPCECPVCNLFGTANPGHEGQDAAEQPSSPHPQAHASRIYVHSAFPAAERAGATLVDRVGIDRQRAAAAENRKFNLEVGNVEAFRGLIEVEDPSSADEQLLAALLGELAEERLWVGGRRASGLGRLQASPIHAYDLDLSNPVLLAAYLEADSFLEDMPALPRFQPVLAPPPGPRKDGLQAPSFVEIACLITFPEFQLVSDPAQALLKGTHGAHLLDGAGQPYLPGSSLRGALRSRCERILRTLSQDGEAACDPFNGCAIALRDFARAADRQPNRQEAWDGSCLACRLFGNEYYASKLSVSAGRLVSERTAPETVDHVAIDRFTGGALDRAKYDIEPEVGTNYSFRLYLRDPEDWMLGLVLLALRDLLEGDLPVGGGTRKGYGRATALIEAWRQGSIGRVLDQPPGAAQTRRGAFSVLEWKGLPVVGSPHTFAQAGDALAQLEELYLQPLLTEVTRHGQREPA